MTARKIERRCRRVKWVDTFKSAEFLRELQTTHSAFFCPILHTLVFCDAENDLIEYFIVYSRRTFHGLSSCDLIENGDGLEQICSLL